MLRYCDMTSYFFMRWLFCSSKLRGTWHFDVLTDVWLLRKVRMMREFFLCGLNVQSLNGKVINVMHIFFFYVMHMLWFNFFLGLNVIFLCLKLIIIHYHTPKQRKIKFKPRKNWTTTHFCHCFSGNSGGSWMTVHSPSINTSSPLQIR